MQRFEHLNKDIIEQISNGLTLCKTASELARIIHFDVSGLIKHIKEYREIHISKDVNKCGYKQSCKVQNICEKCFHKKYGKNDYKCCTCKANCNQLCDLYTIFPDCHRIKKFPYVCNGCEKALHCRLNHFYYDPDKVWKHVSEKRSDSRKGSHFSEGDFIQISKILCPLILEKHQSLPQIYLTHKTELKVSYPTLLKFIDNGLIPNIRNIDLTKRVCFPKSYKKKLKEPTNLAFVKNRTFDDFIEYISENIQANIVEMDTVLSSRDGESCLLTLLFRKSNFMLAFKLKAKTSDEVKKVFSYLQQKLGDKLYANTFEVVLTDNGSEFANPLDIEFSIETGVKLTKLFYCDPGKSGQKGKIEKNHVELRKIFPKPTNFDYFTQKQINIALRHINSEPRGILNGNCPGEIAPIWLNEKVLALNEYRFINRDEVTLHPSLLK